jgi:hypothetical protein
MVFPQKDPHAALTDDIILEKAELIAVKLNYSKFKVSAHWVQIFKKRHGISQLVLLGESGSADKMYIDVARAVLQKLSRLTGFSPHDLP